MESASEMFWHHDVFTLQVFACLEEDLSGRNDDVGTVFLQEKEISRSSMLRGCIIE